MRIAIVTETFHPFKGGSAKRYFEVFKRIAEKGHHVELHTARLENSWPQLEEVEGIKVFRSNGFLPDFITKTGFRSLRQVLRFTWWAMRNLVSKGEIDLIEANHCPIFPTMGSWAVSRTRKKPLSVTFHEAWHSDWYRYGSHSFYAPLGMVLEKAMTKAPDVAITVSETTARRLSSLLGMDRCKIRVVPNGVNLDTIRRVQANRNPHRIIYVGRLNPHKRVELLLRAYQLLKKKFPEILLDIVGDGPLKGWLERCSKEMGLRDVHFWGALGDEEMIRKLKSAGVYVLPSLREGQSITTLEAMSAGTPQVVVRSDGSGAVELVESARSGLVANPNPQDIALKIQKLMLDEDAWKRFNTGGLAYVSRLSWDRVAEEHIKIYEGLLEA